MYSLFADLLVNLESIVKANKNVEVALHMKQRHPQCHVSGDPREGCGKPTGEPGQAPATGRRAYGAIHPVECPTWKTIKCYQRRFNIEYHI